MRPGSKPVVSNAGPLIVLAKLNLLHLLKELFGEVHFSHSVFDEVVIEGMRQGYVDAVTAKLFLEQVGWKPTEVPTPLSTILKSKVEDANISKGEAAEGKILPGDLHLDRGEQDTIALAFTLKSDLVLMDESYGREIARSLGIGVRGSLSILIEAYRKEIISLDQLRLCFAELARREDIWISRALIERLKKVVLEGKDPQEKG